MPSEITRDEVQRLLAAGAQLADVRPATEYEAEHIAGAIHLPLKEIDAHAAARALDRSRPLVVY